MYRRVRFSTVQSVIIRLLVCMVLFSGCSGENTAMAEGLALRQRLLAASGCNFQAEITADYGDQLHVFTLTCACDQMGDLTFQVSEPDTIAGIQGSIAGTGGKLMFDEVALAFPLMAEGEFSPVSAPWVVLKALRSGVVTSAGEDGNGIRVTIADGFDQEELTVDIWIDGEGNPIQGDILHENRRILSVSIKDFQIR